MKSGPNYKNRYANFMQDYGATSPLQMGRQTWADLQNALMDLGKTVMPGVIQGIKGLDVVVKAVSLDIQMFGDMARAAGNGLSGLGGAVSGALHSLGLSSNHLGYSGPHSRSGGDSMIPGVGMPLPYGHPHHPSGLGPQSPYNPGKQSFNDFGLAPPQSSDKSAPPPLSGQGATPVHVHNKTVTYLDGRVLGEAMSSQLAQLSTFPRQAAYGDSYVGWNAPDNNFATE